MTAGRPLLATCPAASGSSTTPTRAGTACRSRTSTIPADDRIVPLGAFRSPPEYTGEWRCDTHPRFSPDGRTVAIDSPHSGEGRQLHVIDLTAIVG